MDNNNILQDFKTLYNIFIREKNAQNESLLLRAIAFYYKLFICYEEKEGTTILDSFRDENNKLILKVYTDTNEMEDKTKMQDKEMQVNFDGILAIVNRNFVDGIVINPKSDNFKLTNVQLMDINRQKMFCRTYDPFELHEDKDFLKPAYKINEVDKNSKNIIELYNAYLKNNDENVLSKFYNELVNHATFFSLVLPEENAGQDEDGHPLISKKRVLQEKETEDKRHYTLYITIQKAIERLGLNENDYISIFNFDDFISMIDSSHNVIKSLKIEGDIDLTIPVDTINELKVQKDRKERNKDTIIMSGEYAHTKENQLLEKQLKEFFLKIDNVEKVWTGLDVYVHNGKTGIKVFAIHAELNSKMKRDIVQELKQIFKNRCFEFKVIDRENEDENLKLIYRKKY